MGVYVCVSVCMCAHLCACVCVCELHGMHNVNWCILKQFLLLKNSKVH